MGVMGQQGKQSGNERQLQGLTTFRRPLDTSKPSSPQALIKSARAMVGNPSVEDDRPGSVALMAPLGEVRFDEG
jgi:hypothetical protein